MTPEDDHPEFELKLSCDSNGINTDLIISSDKNMISIAVDCRDRDTGSYQFVHISPDRLKILLAALRVSAHHIALRYPVKQNPSIQEAGTGP